MKKTKDISKSDATTRISPYNSAFKALMLSILAILLASALSFSALASDINNIRYINVLSGSQLVLNGVVNITQGLNVSDGLIVRSGNVGIGQVMIQ